MRGLAAAMMAVFIVAGCATPASDDSSLKSMTPTTGDEAPARTRARIHTELAAGYYDLGNLAVALEEVKEALSADADYGPAYNVAGLVYARLKEDRLAGEAFERALQINPNDYNAHNNYGAYLCDRKRADEAIRHFLAAVRNPLYPYPDRSYVNAGICARRSGNIPDAESYFDLALKRNPRQTQALFQLAELSYERREDAAAKGYLDRLARAGADAPDVLWLGVRVSRRLGNRNEEASYARQLRNKFPNSREAGALNAGQN